MKLESSIRSIALAAALAVSSAGATAFTLGPIDSTSASFSNTVTGAFTDVWTFSLSSAHYVAASLTNVEITFGGMSMGGILGFAASLNGIPLIGPTSSVVSPPITVTTKVLAGAGGFAPGTYSLTVSGTGITGSSASYGGNIVATPVPEPGTYAMLMAGLGVVGLLVMRRRRQDD